MTHTTTTTKYNDDYNHHNFNNYLSLIPGAGDDCLHGINVIKLWGKNIPYDLFDTDFE